ncbi:MAG: signal recognition particle-docking protein FtsY [Butyrivibrio sp.]|uniref:signal recognition particle-docking protein FtsY n=1 Tax=Butyrivibrio sp. TaxID=28121 RepID=UPI001B4B6A16|nr:signal recognition particle-docking protein FtsY [Butyrivibrio sp.]MBP3784540.1 signal recognition particle-docking protein FtsY [Butyrivibrio sp.]MBP3813974.1 signal recognition particle-docking protein FtsY [Butyrivibrio sp.]
MASFFEKLQQGLSKTRDGIVKGIDNVFSGYSSIDDDFYEELEETLIMGDIGINATSRIIDQLREQVKEQHISDPAKCKALLIQDIWQQMKIEPGAYDFEDKKSVVFVIGVNGVGKTTSVGKLAAIFKKKGKKVIIAAADTYRAAATEQLAMWADRAGCPLVTGKDGSDPASVIYDAAAAFKARDCDILIVDTAGRLHNKKNLMEELAKMNRIIDKELPDICRENFIVLDGTTGQNAIMQAREFGEAASLTGIVLTKLDGTSKGGIAVAIVSELGIPVKYVGVGEGLDDLERFNSAEFVDALFGE